MIQASKAEQPPVPIPADAYQPLQMWNSELRCCQLANVVLLKYSKWCRVRIEMIARIRLAVF